MEKCKCGYRAFNRRRMRKHQRMCEVLKYGQSETRPAERQQAKEELVEAQASQEPVKEEGLEEMTVNELRDLAKAKGLTGIYGKNKQELIETLRGQCDE